MERIALVDASYLVALVTASDYHHRWAETVAPPLDRAWVTCEAVISEACYLAGHKRDGRTLLELLRRGVVRIEFDLSTELSIVLALMEKYSDVPMSLADACLVRMTELLPDAVLFTTDSDFRVYRRHGRRTIPCVMPE